MKHIMTFFSILILFSSSSLWAQDMQPILIPGTQQCSNTGTSIAYDSNVRVSVPSEVIQGDWMFSFSDYSLEKKIQVEVAGKTCVLEPWDGKQGTILERVNIILSCEKGSIIEQFAAGSYQSVEMSRLCKSAPFMIRRLSYKGLYFDEKSRTYQADEDTEILYNDTKSTFGFTTASTQYEIPFETGHYIDVEPIEK